MRSRPPRNTAATATARPSASGCWRLYGCRARTRCGERWRELLAARGLPLTFEGAAVDDVLDAAARDKKREGGRVPFVLVEAPGEVSHGHDIPPGDLRAAVEELHSG